MASSNTVAKRQRGNGSDSEDDGEKHIEKKTRVVRSPIAPQLAHSLDVEWTTTGKRSRSKSNDADERNVRARMRLNLSCTNPEPASFLMGAIASELENISQMISQGGSPSSSPSGVHHTPSSSSKSHSPSSSSSTSPQSSPDYYDRLVMRGHEMLESMRRDPDLMKYFSH